MKEIWHCGQESGCYTWKLLGDINKQWLERIYGIAVSGGGGYRTVYTGIEALNVTLLFYGNLHDEKTSGQSYDWKKGE